MKHSTVSNASMQRPSSACGPGPNSEVHKQGSAPAIRGSHLHVGEPHDLDLNKALDKQHTAEVAGRGCLTRFLNSVSTLSGYWTASPGEGGAPEALANAATLISASAVSADKQESAVIHTAEAEAVAATTNDDAEVYGGERCGPSAQSVFLATFVGLVHCADAAVTGRPVQRYVMMMGAMDIGPAAKAELEALLERGNITAVVEQVIVPPRAGRAPFIFPRNLAIQCHDDIYLVSDIEKNPNQWKSNPRLFDIARGTAMLGRQLNKMGIATKTSDGLVMNAANLHYARDEDLLIMALDDRQGGSVPCNEAPQPARGCNTELTALTKGFGPPKHAIRFESAMIAQAGQVMGKCYDLDLYMHLTSNTEGKKFVLLYADCIRAKPATQVAGRQKVIDRLTKEFGMEVILMGKADFERLAGNALSPKPGFIVFPLPVSPELKEALVSRGIEVVEGDPEKTNLTDKVHFAVHCLALEADKPVPGKMKDL